MTCTVEGNILDYLEGLYCQTAQMHRIFNTASDWHSFHVDFEKNQDIWTENQHPTEWSSSILKLKWQQDTRGEYRGGIDIEVFVQIRKLFFNC